MEAGLKGGEKSSYQEVRGGGEGKRRELLSCSHGYLAARVWGKGVQERVEKGL
jgi:hypothetical protein